MTKLYNAIRAAVGRWQRRRLGYAPVCVTKDQLEKILFRQPTGRSGRMVRVNLVDQLEKILDTPGLFRLPEFDRRRPDDAAVGAALSRARMLPGNRGD